MSPDEALDDLYSHRTGCPDPSCGVCSRLRAAHDVLLALLRRDWAVRVICAANADARHFSFPYPHRLGGFEMIQTPERRADILHHGDTVELCLINAADAVFPDLDEKVRSEIGARP